ncbi:hypothetical protein [Cytobacillus gottheilii]|uniref:Uncharacterized protein n=1 Tax=Cytobacillus gottheilii TaxID=859144 RepID=A0ABX8FFX5_9BACI|nr:hypothetical protein [Cytobacillus gottheilii]QVY62936.1 hypothetical protein J1899_07800 [Cytobacillus gottheilii]
MTTQVSLPRNVAEALEEVKPYYRNAEIIATIGRHRKTMVYGTRMDELIAFAHSSYDNLDVLMSALVNGYQIEKSPEELEAERHETLLETYIDLLEKADSYPLYAHAKYLEGKADGIKIALNTLGIQIEGVNA